MYLSGEIHTDWRQQIVDGTTQRDLPVTFSSPVTGHAAMAWATTPGQVVEILDYVTGLPANRY